VALTKVTGRGEGGFRLLPRSHKLFVEAFKRRPDRISWGAVKQKICSELRSERLDWCVPELHVGDVVVAHMFTFHGTDFNFGSSERHMIFQRRTSKSLHNEGGTPDYHLDVMTDLWLYFNRQPPS
jgi:ectoine hydroxylase-related dioxygenase (phytanoyl-CoA dioxygenase family)